MLKAVIVDDEVLAIELITTFLDHMEGVSLIASFTSALEALAYIREYPPDVVFLDIEMPDQHGIRIGELLLNDGIDVSIVYVTAYQHYALEAFGVYAFDYITKPVDEERLRRTVSRLLIKHNYPPLRPGQSPPAASGGLSASLMGAFELLDKRGEPVKWRTKKVKELCAYLLHHPQPVHRLKVIEDLWPDTPLDKAVTLLYTTVYQLRRMFRQQGCPGAVSYVDERFSLNAAVATDVGLLGTLMRGQVYGERQIREILKLSERDYLDDEDYPWSVSRQTALKTECRAFLDACLSAHAAGELYGEVFEELLLKLIDIAPYDKRYYELLSADYDRHGYSQKAKNIQALYREVLRA